MVRLLSLMFLAGTLLALAGHAAHSTTTLAVGVLACAPGLVRVVQLPARSSGAFLASAAVVGVALAVLGAHHGAPIAAMCMGVTR